MTDFRKLADEVDGPVFLPGDRGYNAERATRNPLKPLRPAVVVGAAGVADVRAAVRFAGANDLAVAILGGGHMQPYVAEGAVLVTLERMSAVRVDPARRSARITGAVRWGAVIDAAARFGLAPMSGSSTTVAAIGYLLGGGQGPILSRLYGYASDHVTSFEIVTADGELRTVSAGREPGLFAALRGGKGNFGVVTAAEIDLFPVASVFAGGIYLPGRATAEVLPAWRDWAATLPEQATTSVAIQRLPPVDDLPAPLRGQHVLHLRYAFAGPADHGRELLEPVRHIAPALLDTVTEAAFPIAAVLHNDPVVPIPYQDRSLGLAALPDEALTTLAELAGPELASVELRALGGAMDRAPATPDSVPSRGLPYQLFAFAVGGLADAQRLREPLERLFDGMRPWADPRRRRMVNFLSPDEALDPRSLREVYGPEIYDRLLKVKNEYDPREMFRMNHTVRPL